MSIIISPTEVDNYYRCERKWDLTSLNRQRLTPIKPQEPLEIGTMVHVAGALWISQPDKPFADHLMAVATSRLEQLTNIYEVAYNHPPPRDILDEYWKWATLARAMCANYQAYWKTPLPTGYVLVQPEQQVVVAIPGTEHCECPLTKVCEHSCDRCKYDGRDHTTNAWCACTSNQYANDCVCIQQHYLAGQLDAIIADAQARHFVYERKTYGQRPNPRHLQRNSQFLAYNWILDISTPNAAGIAYDGMWKRATPPPGKKLEDLFFRYYMSRTPAELDEFEKQIAITAVEMAAIPQGIHTRKVVPAVKGCIDCLPFIDYCDAISEDNSLPLNNFVLRDYSPAFRAFYGKE